jgi:hypothetical protein
VTPLATVGDFDELENVTAILIVGPVVAMMHQLGFLCVEKLSSVVLFQQFP